MFRKIFGPFPDEPLMYGLDRILGLFLKFDITNKSSNSAMDGIKNEISKEATNEIKSIDGKTNSDVKIIPIIHDIENKNNDVSSNCSREVSSLCNI